MRSHLSFLRKLEATRPFTETEAWNLFRISAIAEACGWTLLIGGIIVQRYQLPGHRFAVLITGQIHGIIFLTYFGVLIAVYSSLRWPRVTFVVAALAGVPPYGTLVFEQWAARSRRKQLRQALRHITVHAIITDKEKLLALQPGNSIKWRLPGGSAKAHETPEEALSRILQSDINVTTSSNSLQYIVQSKHHAEEHLAFYFKIALEDIRDMVAMPEILQRNLALDDIRFIDPQTTPDLEPHFLQTQPVQEKSDTGVMFITA